MFGANNAAYSSSMSDSDFSDDSCDYSSKAIDIDKIDGSGKTEWSKEAEEAKRASLLGADLEDPALKRV